MTSPAGPDGGPPLVSPVAAVGQRARALRTGQKLTLDELSTRSGVSRRAIALLEAGEANPSLGTLDKLARALGVEFAALVAARPTAPLVAAAAHGVDPVWQDDLGSSARLLASRRGGSHTELWQWELAPGGRYQAEPDPPGSEEMIWVAGGCVVVETGPDRFELGEGGYLRLPSDRPYAYANGGEVMARFVRVAVT